MNPDQHRLLPRYREQGTYVDQARMRRTQANILRAALDANPEAKLPLRHALTKPGDPRQLRGIPAIGRSVSGAIPGTNPEQAAIAACTRAEHISEWTAA